MKISTLLRANDWWEPKMVPLLIVGYMTIIHLNENIINHMAWLLLLISAMTVGAIYVSILNDYTDLPFDLASKKSNRLESFSPFKRKLLLTVSILLSIAFCFFFIDDMLSLCFYWSAYIAFSLYSISPFRFKNRGILGVIADASGAHLLTSLFIVTSLTHKMGKELDIYWLSMIGFWAFLYGLRGILCHQYFDRENDLSINQATFATDIQVSSIKPAEKVITLLEIGVLFILLCTLGELLPLIALAIYFIILLGYKKLNQEVIFILINDKPWHIFLSDYYQILLPFSLIISCSFENPTCLVLIIFHVLFFPRKLKLLVKNVLLMMRLKRII
ncbi:hypothetical protein V7S79_11125 [Aquirufa sp. ROCK-SH2]